jgi:hypothetical protein
LCSLSGIVAWGIENWLQADLGSAPGIQITIGNLSSVMHAPIFNFFSPSEVIDNRF